MRIRLAAAALVLAALPSFAAVQYDFVQKNTTDDKISPTTDLTGRATVDGLRSRIDFLGGTVYPPGTYMISTDGAQRRYYVDPVKKWYTEQSSAALSAALASSDVRIANFKSKLETVPDRPVLIGIETTHTRLHLSYDITVTRKTVSIRSHVETEIESWTTDRYGPALNAAFSPAMQTGNPDIDRLLLGETSKLTGFPLRQTVTTRTTFDLPAKSQINVAPTRTIVRETWVTAVREVPPDATMFAIPAGFRRADAPEAPKSATDVLTFEPPPAR